MHLGGREVSARLDARSIGAVPVVSVRNADGEWSVASSHVPTFDSMLTRIADPQRAPEVLTVRETIRAWRFYDHFRVDAEAPIRSPQLGTRTPTLANDGRDLGPALQTIREIGDNEALDRTIQDAFPGSVLEIEHSDGRFSIGLKQPGMLRRSDRRRVVGRNAAFSAVVGGTADAATAAADGAQRTGDEPASRSAAGARAADPRGVEAIAAMGRVALGAADRGAGGKRIVQFAAAAKDLGETQIVGQGLMETPAWTWPLRR